MGKLYSYTFMSLDGIFESPEKWTGPFFDDQLAGDLTARLSSASGMVLGRQTYNEFSAFWPLQPADAPFAALNTNIRKFVISDSLLQAGWHNSTIVRRDGIPMLKTQQPKDLHITGSGTLVRSLMLAGLLDEFHFVVFPVALGSGRRLLDDVKSQFELVTTTSYARGVVHSAYKPKAAPISTARQ